MSSQLGQLALARVRGKLSNSTFGRNQIEQKETKYTKEGSCGHEAAAMTTDCDTWSALRSLRELLFNIFAMHKLAVCATTFSTGW